MTGLVRLTSRPAVLGQAAVDYVLVLALVGVALSVGADSPVQQLVAAIAEHYRRFTWAISLP
jgi:hypothetical protein